MYMCMCIYDRMIYSSKNSFGKKNIFFTVGTPKKKLVSKKIPPFFTRGFGAYFHTLRILVLHRIQGS